MLSIVGWHKIFSFTHFLSPIGLSLLLLQYVISSDFQIFHNHEFTADSRSHFRHTPAVSAVFSPVFAFRLAAEDRLPVFFEDVAVFISWFFTFDGCFDTPFSAHGVFLLCIFFEDDISFLFSFDGWQYID